MANGEIADSFCEKNLTVNDSFVRQSIRSVLGSCSVNMGKKDVWKQTVESKTNDRVMRLLVFHRA